MLPRSGFPARPIFWGQIEILALRRTKGKDSVTKKSLVGSTAETKTQTSKTEGNPLKANSLDAHSMKKRKSMGHLAMKKKS